MAKQPDRRVLKFHPDEYPLLARLIELRPRGWGVVVRDLVEAALREGKYPLLAEEGAPGEAGERTGGEGNGPRPSADESQSASRMPAEPTSPLQGPEATSDTSEKPRPRERELPSAAQVSAPPAVGVAPHHQEKKATGDAAEAQANPPVDSDDQVAQRARNLLTLHNLSIGDD